VRRIDPKVQRHLRRFALPAATLATLGLPLGSDFGDYTPSPDPSWSPHAIERLEYWAKAAPGDALPSADTSELDAALQRGNARATDRAAAALALRLAHAHLLGAAPASQRFDWRVADSDTAIDLTAQLRDAITADKIDDFFASLRPDNPAYTVLKGALAAETDPVRRTTLARNMERWRWLPRSLGDDYLLANAAGFEVTLWRSGKRYKSWAAISGKVKTPTPAISAVVKAVNFNPWWEVPDSIAKESNLAGRGSYVWTGKRFRQKPGPGNALGQMKLVMPNPYNIYLHDTPSRGLFGLGERAFSHGCIRVGDALGFALTLLEGSVTREAIDKRLKAPEGGEVQSFSVPLPQELPVYVTYFTADMRADGSVAFHKDIYGRDGGIGVQP
jgi:murein L,D-transpeptidase YcbB/YkuD